MLRAICCTVLLIGAAALAAFAALADRAWFLRHVVVPAYYLPPPPITLPLLRLAVAVAAIALVFCARLALRRATPGGAVRVVLAVGLSLVASELVMRAVERPEVETPNPRLEWRLGDRDPRTGWAFVPRRSLVVTAPRTGRAVRYDIDAHGNRADSVDFIEDPRAPTLLVAGESIAAGHGLAWKDTFAAKLGRRLGLQIVNVAEGGYGSDQAFLRVQGALARLERPVALVETVMSVQLHRNIQDDRARLVLRDGNLVAAPPSESRLRLRELFVNQLPYLSEGRLARAVRLTQAVLRETARLAQERGAKVLFVTPSLDPDRVAQPMLDSLLEGLPHLTVEVDPAQLLPYDGHPDELGADRIADAIAAALR
ncbi:MAG TPA: hypothetical protein VFE90_12905 [Myxococcales bacterium]|nr:hypothetical protein [Myxococcales bacterium]